MGDSERRPAQVELLEQIEDEIVSIIESLVQDYTGEAKRDILELVGTLQAMTALDTGYRDALVAPLEAIFEGLLRSYPEGNAHHKLVGLRRTLMNTRMGLLGRAIKYSYADPLAAKDAPA